MGKKVEENVVKQEADNLKRLFNANDITNISKFAANLSPRRTRGEVHQHIHGTRPIPLSAAKSYAEALGLSVRDISPRWAAELDDGGKQLSDITGSLRPKVKKLLDLLEQIDDDGLQELIGQAKLLRREYPRTSQKRRA